MNIKALRQLLNRGQLEPFVRHIRFPQYKNLAPFTKIEFTFPITAIVGANGTNKSSVLRALYGAPGYNNLGNFWFSTETDPIEEGDKFANCFVYAYQHPETKENIEVLKTRVKKDKDPDYWEPSRPLRQYGMEPMPAPHVINAHRTKTRWRPITKKVELVDFRHALSAFDRYFYYGNFSRTATFKNKKDFVRSRAGHLNAAIAEFSSDYLFHKKDRIVNKENRLLSAEELASVCDILGREYEEVRLIRHSFFNQEGYTAKLKLKDLGYTEAFAGSGEFAVVKLVTSIFSAPKKSLILLDEPEVSLHPGAQERLLEFLAEQVLQKKHQIVLTTHSPALIRLLPSDAIKVLALESLGQEVVLISQKALPEEAFLDIGEPIAGVRTILVEDRLAAEIVRKALRDHYPRLLDVVALRFFPGGSSVVFSHYIPPYAMEKRSDVLCLLDGDETPADPWPDEVEIRRLLDSELAGAIDIRTGNGAIEFITDGGPAPRKAQQLALLRRQYLAWCHRYVRYLPGNRCPEGFILGKLGMDDGTDAKKQCVQIAREQFGLLANEGPSSDDIFNAQRSLLAMIDREDPEIKAIAETVNGFLADRGNE